jgi:hypothetical protein
MYYILPDRHQTKTIFAVDGLRLLAACFAAERLLAASHSVPKHIVGNG